MRFQCVLQKKKINNNQRFIHKKRLHLTWMVASWKNPLKRLIFFELNWNCLILKASPQWAFIKSFNIRASWDEVKSWGKQMSNQEKKLSNESNKTAWEWSDIFLGITTATPMLYILNKKTWGGHHLTLLPDFEVLCNHGVKTKAEN